MVLGRSAGLGSTLFVPAFAPRAPIVNLFDYYYHPRSNDLADELTPTACRPITSTGGPPPTPWTCSTWRIRGRALDALRLAARPLPGRVPRRLRGDPRRRRPPPLPWPRHAMRVGPADDRRPIGAEGREGRHLRRPRARPAPGLRPLPGAGEPADAGAIGRDLRRRRRRAPSGGRWTSSTSAATTPRPPSPRDPPHDPDRFWMLGAVSRREPWPKCSRASDLHVDPSRPYSVSRSLAGGDGRRGGRACLGLGAGPRGHRRRTGTPCSCRPTTPTPRPSRALEVLADPAGHRPIGEAAAAVGPRTLRPGRLPRGARRAARRAGEGSAGRGPAGHERPVPPLRPSRRSSAGWRWS